MDGQPRVKGSQSFLARSHSYLVCALLCCLSSELLHYSLRLECNSYLVCALLCCLSSELLHYSLRSWAPVNAH